MINKEKILSILIGLFLAIFFLKCKSKTQEGFYNESVDVVLTESYHGVVIEKFYDKFNHGINKVILFNDGVKKEIDFTYETPNLYKYIRIGDALTKKKNILKLHLKRKKFDTIIEFKFENIKGYKKFNK